MVDSPKSSRAVVVIGARCAGVTGFPSGFGGGVSSRWWCSSFISCSYGSDATSSCLTSGKEAPGGL
jgi:hypothetical protein